MSVHLTSAETTSCLQALAAGVHLQTLKLQLSLSSVSGCITGSMLKPPHTSSKSHMSSSREETSGGEPLGACMQPWQVQVGNTQGNEHHPTAYPHWQFIQWSQYWMML